MKKIYLSLILLLSLGSIKSQAPFWTENFGTGCDQGQLANGFNPGMGVWTTSNTGVNDAEPNKWFISATESGMGVGNCGDGCLGTGTTNRTLHIGPDFMILGIPITDNGAAYSAGPGYNSNVRVQSPLISCAGQSNIALSFNYFLGGVAGSDYFEVQYSANGGTTWSVISTPSITPSGTCGTQGKWTSYSISLPATANNNANVKIGFRWQNIDPSGNDPSVAIDDISLASVSTTFAPTFTLPASICASNSTSVTAITGTFAVSGYTWSTSPTGPTFGTPNTSTTTINFPTSGTYSITLTATSGTTTASSTKTILVNALPVLTPTVNPSSICAGQSATISLGGATNYTWNPGALSGTQNVVSPSVTTTYTIIGATGSCTSSIVKTVTVGTTLSLSLTANPSTVCSGASSTLTANGASNYTWSPGGTNGSSVVVTPSTTTTYSALGTTSGCSGNSAITVTVVVCSSIEQFNKDQNVYTLYPNPVNEKLFITSISAEQNIRVQIIDAIGKLMLQEDLNVTKNDPAGIDLRSLTKGIYFIQIHSGKSTYTTKFIKE